MNEELKEIYEYLLVVKGRINDFLPATCPYHDGQMDLIDVLIRDFFKKE